MNKASASPGRPRDFAQIAFFIGLIFWQFVPTVITLLLFAMVVRVLRINWKHTVFFPLPVVPSTSASWFTSLSGMITG